MVRAILEGRKAQTRRIVKKQPRVDPETGDWLSTYSDGSEQRLPIEWWMELKLGFDCPYGQPGDRLWVRETWAEQKDTYGIGDPHAFFYRADKSMKCADTLDPLDDFGVSYEILKWKPSIHMPRVACRLLLEITDVRIERLQNISRVDAIAEGVFFSDSKAGYVTDDNGSNFNFSHPEDSFRDLWCSINGGYGHESWDANPWVWVISFEKLDL